ncbi:hypothetical protein PIECOFPK_00051 [Mycovorax composti]|jgi:hypothetical protein|uniref:Uncharacterized protein n=2 Tax=Chitinophagaceae TaxID=563835 RepID=A0ABZ2EFT1_9BACT
MRYFKFYRALFVVLLATFTIFTLASWTIPMIPGFFQKFFAISDTIPSQRDKKIAELNEAITQLEKAVRELKHRDIASEVSRTIEGINLDIIHCNVEKAVVQVKSALKIKEIQPVKDELNNALSKISKGQIEEQVKMATMLIQPQLEKNLKEAQEELEKAKKELESVREHIRNKKMIS